MHHPWARIAGRVVLLSIFLSACEKAADPDPGSAAAVPAAAYDQIARIDFNRKAVRLNLPVYWSEDLDRDAVPRKHRGHVFQDELPRKVDVR